MNETAPAWFLVGVLVGVGIFVIGYATIGVSDFHREAIAHHAAQFNPQTGKFQWLDEKEKK